MKLLFQLSGEHPNLPRAELLAVLEGEKRAYDILFENDRIMIVDVANASFGAAGTDFLGRLALSIRFGEFVSFSNTIQEAAFSILMRLPRHKTVAVRSKSHTLEEELGTQLSAMGYNVDLEEPDTSILLFEIDGRYVTALGIPAKRGFAARRPQFRPYFHPTSMHPKLARVLVNLARVRKGEQVLDPFRISPIHHAMHPSLQICRKI